MSMFAASLVEHVLSNNLDTAIFYVGEQVVWNSAQSSVYGH